MENKSLCSKCMNCFRFTAVNSPGGSGNRTKAICLIYPKAWDDLVWGMFKQTEPYPYINECSHFKEKKDK